MAISNRILLIMEEGDLADGLTERLMADLGYSVSVASNAEGGLLSLRQDGFDAVITRFGMPDMQGQELIKAIKIADEDCVVIVYAEHFNKEMLDELVSLGVFNYISKPINFEKLLFTIKIGAQLHSRFSANSRIMQGLKEHNTALEKQNTLLARRIEDSTKNLTRLYEDLRSTYMRTIKVLAQTIDARDHYTHSHSQNVARFAVIIATELALSAKEIENIREACELHDLGKIGIMDTILTKPSALTSQEWAQMRRHPEIGAQILEPLTFLGEVTELVREHHEHYDGSGYPDGRKGEDIPLGARIIHLADAYETMRSARSYRKDPLLKEDAIAEIKKNSGTQFDPKLVEVFLRVVDRLY